MMNHLAMQGLVRRRILVNFRVDPEVIRRRLPAPFRPKLVGDWAMAGICLLRLEQLRPRGLPSVLGLSSENAAHRVAVTWTDDRGELCEGVYIPRRDTAALLNQVSGGRLFPGQQRPARIQVRDSATAIDVKMDTEDGGGDVWLRARPSDGLPTSSHFPSLEAASRFFLTGAVGYSARADSPRVDGLRLKMHTWSLATLDVDWVVSSYFADTGRFPAGSVEYDCTLIMRDVHHEWQYEPEPSRSAAGCIV